MRVPQEVQRHPVCMLVASPGVEQLFKARRCTAVDALQQHSSVRGFDLPVSDTDLLAHALLTLVLDYELGITDFVCVALAEGEDHWRASLPHH